MKAKKKKQESSNSKFLINNNFTTVFNEQKNKIESVCLELEPICAETSRSVPEVAKHYRLGKIDSSLTSNDAHASDNQPRSPRIVKNNETDVCWSVRMWAMMYIPRSNKIGKKTTQKFNSFVMN